MIVVVIRGAVSFGVTAEQVLGQCDHIGLYWLYYTREAISLIDLLKH